MTDREEIFYDCDQDNGEKTQIESKSSLKEENNANKTNDALAQEKDINSSTLLDQNDEVSNSDNKKVDSSDEEDQLLSEQEIEDGRKKALQFKTEGNSAYKEEKYSIAIDLYTEGLLICPKSCKEERSALFNNRSICLDLTGQKEKAITDCTKAIKINKNYIKAIRRRAKLYQESEKFEESQSDWESLLQIPNISSQFSNEAKAALFKLKQQIEERNEKLKTEMMGQLKKLGNMCLKPFGLSTNNFKLEQNEQGSYSCQFVQHPETNS